MTEEYILINLRKKLSTDANWAKRGLLAIFANQTTSEQIEASVREHNNMGFRSCDSRILTSLASQLKNRGNLSSKQIEILFKKMPVYARQLLKFHNEKVTAYFKH
jgi:hypothetical protein